MAKHFGDASLTQILTLVKEKIDILLGKIEEKQQPFIITATVDFASRTLTYVSHSFDEIHSAYDLNKHIVLHADIGQMMPNGKAAMPLVMINDSEAVFSIVIWMNGAVNFAGGIKADDSTYVFDTPLQEAISVVSDESEVQDGKITIVV